METPQVWQELKKLQFEQENKKKKGIVDGQSENSNNDKSNTISDPDNQYQDFEENMQFDYAEDANKRLLNTELKNIEKQRNQAAGKIGREAKVRFDMGKEDEND